MVSRPSHLALIAAHPSKLIWSIYQTTAYLVILFLHRLLLPFACRATDFRTEITRCFLGSFLANFWDLLFKAPIGLREDQYRNFNVGGVPAVLVPPTAPFMDAGMMNPKPDLLILYAHGGGYLFGEPLMYMSTYERWIHIASTRGIDLAIVSVDYSKFYPCCALR